MNNTATHQWTKLEANTRLQKPSIQSLQESIKDVIENYLGQLNGEAPYKFYELFINEVELPLLENVLKHTHGNQSKAAIYLGISRGTLRTRMKKYNLL